MLSNSHAKIYFELHYEAQVSDRTWYRLKRAMRESGLEINPDNLRLIADLKRKGQYTKLSLKQLIYCQKQAQELANKRIVIKGDLVFKELKRQTQGKAHKTTILRWFKSIGKVNGNYFDKEREYKAEELVPVFAMAFLYMAKLS
jgi:hypothetical protein